MSHNSSKKLLCPRPELHLTYMIDIAMTTEFALDVASGAR